MDMFLAFQRFRFRHKSGNARKNIPQDLGKRIVDVPVLQFQESVEVSMNIPQVRVSQRMPERFDGTAIQIQGQIEQVAKIIPHFVLS